jgi:hypothetical protein
MEQRRDEQEDGEGDRIGEQSPREARSGDGVVA